jgi:hypothetical protein
MRRVLVLLLLSCAPSFQQSRDQCLNHLGEDASSLDNFRPGDSGGGVFVEGVGPPAYSCCPLTPTSPGGVCTVTVDCTGVTLGAVGSPWDDVAVCFIAVLDGKVVAAWVKED